MTEKPQLVLLDYDASQGAVSQIEIASIEELKKMLKDLVRQQPRIVDLVSHSGNRLQLGIGGAFGCAQLIRADNMPPYINALAHSPNAGGDVEFLLGGTPTPVPPERCLSVEEAMRIAEYFFMNDDAEPTTRWEEI